MTCNAAMFQKFIDQVDAEVGTDSSSDGSIGLFHLLAAAVDWCDERSVDFDATLGEVREHFATFGKEV